MKIIKWLLIGLILYISFLLVNMPATIFFRWLKLPAGFKIEAIQGNFWQGSAKITRQAMPDEVFEMGWTWCPQLPRLDTACIHLTQDKLSASALVPLISKTQFKLQSLQLATPSQALQGLLPTEYQLILHQIHTKIEADLSRLYLRFIDNQWTVSDWQGSVQLSQFTYMEKNLGNMNIKLDTAFPEASAAQEQQTTNPVARLAQQNILRLIVSGGAPDVMSLAGTVSITPDKRYQIQVELRLHDTSLSTMMAAFTKQTGEQTYLWTYQGKL